MRRPIFLVLCLAGAFALSACEKSRKADVQRALDDINVIDDSNLSDIMLTVADPNEAVTYFERASKAKPDRVDLQRGLAKSLVRAKRPEEAIVVWQGIIGGSQADNQDHIGLADALIRTGAWKQAGEELNKIPPTFETYDRYRLEAMVADSKKDWKRADSFYETAAGLTTKPAGVLNNWGYSKLSRGDFTDAEALFGRAIRYDSKLFTAKNNLVLALGAQGKYDLPLVPMSQVERAQLLYTMALSAIKRGDVATGRGLLKEAIDTHPQYFEAAVRSLRTLDNNVTN